MRVVLTTHFEIQDEQMNVNALEQVVAQAWREFPSQAWNAIAAQIEAQAEHDHQGALKRKGRETRCLWTQAGLVKLQRQRYRHPAENKSFLLFDLRVGLERRQAGTQAAQMLFAQLAAMGPSYRAACDQLKLIWGEAPAVGTGWRWTQNQGAALEAAARDTRNAFCYDGELPGAELAAKSFVALETDSTFVHAWREKGSHEVYLGVAYDGKELHGKRRKLTGKIAVASTAGSNVFGLDFFLAAQARHNVCEADTLLFLSDGALALEGVRDECFPHALHQLDHAHVVRRTRDAYGWDLLPAAERTLKLIFAERKHALFAKLERDKLRHQQQAGAINELSAYLRNHWEWLFVVRRLRKAGRQLPPHVEGSGVIERNIGVYIGQRMKHRGMGWTKRGASNILRIRLELFLQAS